MAYLRISDDIDDHPQFFGLSDRAFRVWVYCGVWCQKHLTDGVIPRAMALQLRRSTPAMLNELVAAGLLESDGADLRVVGFLKHNDSREQVQSRRLALAKRQGKWRERNAVTNGNGHAVTNGVPHLTSPNLEERKN